MCFQMPHKMHLLNMWLLFFIFQLCMLKLCLWCQKNRIQIVPILAESTFTGPQLRSHKWKLEASGPRGIFLFLFPSLGMRFHTISPHTSTHPHPLTYLTPPLDHKYFSLSIYIHYKTCPMQYVVVRTQGFYLFILFIYISFLRARRWFQSICADCRLLQST